VYAGEGNDRVVISRSVRYDAVVWGGDGRDRLYAGSRPATMYGEDGDDRLYGGSSRDALYGGPGSDRLYGRRGDDGLFGEEGDDRLYGSSGDDVLVGGGGDDRLSGGCGDDLLVGGGGADRISGHCGSDILIAGTTIYDASLPLLDALLQKWRAEPNSYAHRVDRVLSDSGDPLGDPFLQAGITVFDDQAPDRLTGGFGRDLYFADLDDADDDDDVVLGLRRGWRPEALIDLAEIL
jgi:Ca2+-binding RTX toxin-like protein